MISCVGVSHLPRKRLSEGGGERLRWPDCSNCEPCHARNWRLNIKLATRSWWPTSSGHGSNLNFSFISLLYQSRPHRVLGENACLPCGLWLFIRSWWDFDALAKAPAVTQLSQEGAKTRIKQNVKCGDFRSWANIPEGLSWVWLFSWCFIVLIELRLLHDEWNHCRPISSQMMRIMYKDSWLKYLFFITT